MIALLAPAFFAALVALALYGAPADWAHIRVRWQPLALGALLVQLVLFNPPLNHQPWALEWGPWIWVISMLGMLAAFVKNAAAGGTSGTAWLVAGLGVVLNLAAVTANGGQMPVSPQALAFTKGEAHLHEHSLAQDAPAQLSNVVLIGPETRLTGLGDVLPEPAWLPGANVVSVGDLVLAAGLAWWAFYAISFGSRRRVGRPAGAETT